MTREEINDTFHVSSDGIIQREGSFFGLPAWVPYYCDLGADGEGDGEEKNAAGDTVCVFNIDVSDVEIWPELANVRTVRVWVDDDLHVGFSAEYAC